MKKYKLNKETHRMKISQYLREIQNYSGRSFRNIKVYLNGKQVKTTKKLPSSGMLYVEEKIKETNIEPMYIPLDIVYEDDDLLVINKEPFIITHPTLKKVDKTLANGVVYYFLEKYGKKLVPRFYNRLDMNTSGLIIIAKNAYAQAKLSNNRMEKKYLAILEGIIPEDIQKIEIDKPIYKDGDNLARIIDDRGQSSKTILKVIKRYNEKNVTLVECELFTGRTHQIRVHALSEGFALVGDKLYNSQSKIIVGRQMLHSYYNKFIHPVSGNIIELKIDMPEDFKKFLELL